MDRKLILDYNSGQIVARLDKSSRTLVDGVALQLHSGETVALIGETGSGKTLTALSVMRLLPENIRMQNAVILFDGHNLFREKHMQNILGIEIVYIPQNGLEFLNPSKKVKYHLYDSLKKLGVPRENRRQKALEALGASGFDTPDDIIEKYPFQLSGGMAQRVTIALAFCSEARLLIADEPTNGLDQASTENFMHLLKRMFPEAAKLIITHDISVASLCDRTQVLCGGKTMECGPSQQVLQAPQHPYTAALIAALVQNGMTPSPSLREQKGSCPFYCRCIYAGESCLSGLTRQTNSRTEWWCAKG